MLGRSLIAISADEIGDVTDEPSDDELRRRLRQAPQLAGRSEQALGQFVTYWRSFRSTMNIGDIVVVPLHDRRAAVGEIAGDYSYRPDEPEPRLRHVRRVTWLSTLQREELDEDLRRVVNSPGTICTIGAPNATERLRRLST
jgi:predicted Mrr-cat superfamily restriction endonuclease